MLALITFESAQDTGPLWSPDGEVDPKGWTKFGRRLDGAAR